MTEIDAALMDMEPGTAILLAIVLVVCFAIWKLRD